MVTRRIGRYVMSGVFVGRMARALGECIFFLSEQFWKN